jgi:hypothetical protein
MVLVAGWRWPQFISGGGAVAYFVVGMPAAVSVCLLLTSPTAAVDLLGRSSAASSTGFAGAGWQGCSSVVAHAVQEPGDRPLLLWLGIDFVLEIILSGLSGSTIHTTSSPGAMVAFACAADWQGGRLAGGWFGALPCP